MRSILTPRLKFPEPQPVVRPSEQEIIHLSSLLNQSHKVTIFGGAGCAGAHSELVKVAGLLKAPIVHALRGKEFIEYDEIRYDVGMTGLLGFSSGYHAMMNCDTFAHAGQLDFPYQQFYPEKLPRSFKWTFAANKLDAGPKWTWVW